MNREQYAELLEELSTAYDQSDIKNAHAGWWYGVAATRILPFRPLIVGFNWGASTGHYRPTPTDFPTETLAEQMDRAGELGSLVRLRPYLQQYVGQVRLDEIGQSNLYFFRTRKANQLSENDRRLCIPIFMKLLSFARPSLVIALSNSVSSVLAKLEGFSNDVQMREFVMNSRGQKFTAIRGRMGPSISGRWIAVPHPATPCLAETRKAIWSYCLPASD